jgi:glycosyltransferase involved in cell wall biosynthesis
MPAKKIIYIANARLPTEKAHGIQITKMCEAFAAAGNDVELIVPRRLNRIKGDVFSQYDVQKNFTVRKLCCFDLLMLPLFKSFWFFLEAASFAISVWFHLLLNRGTADALVYTRDLSAIALLSSSHSIVYEVHRLPERSSWLFRRLLGKVNRFVAISQGLKDDLVALGISGSDIVMAPDAVDVAQFDISESQSDCRKALHLPADKHIVMYTGHLYAWKGADTLLAAAGGHPDKLFVFVGGTTHDAKRFEEATRASGADNVLVIKHTTHRMIPSYLKAADIIVIPNSGKSVISARHTSPLKAFEAMSARRPIVASDLPSLREILDDATATFFRPDDAQSLADAIGLVFAHREESAQKADRAYERVKSQDWNARAKNILSVCAA